MKAMQLKGYGAADNYELVDIPVPEPADDEVLIKVALASAVYADVVMRTGGYPFKPPFPYVGGREVAGTIEKVGAKVEGLRPGMRVTADMQTGAYAEYAVAKHGKIMIVPNRASFDQAIVYHSNMLVAYLAYYTFGNLQPGESILVHAAAGGIGSVFTQIAKQRGTNMVIALASNDEKLDFCRKIGADYVVNVSTSNYADEVLRITNGKGVDVSFNSVTGPTLRTDLHAIRQRGKWLLNGFAAGIGTLEISAELMLKSFTIIPFSIYSVVDRPEFKQAYDFRNNWLATKELLSVTRTFRLEDVAEAHRWIESRRSFGKVVLIP
ncbi:MAG: zinc-binding dehydrogenase [Desulfatitalea sp.]|nr:zinc-binding dehydrogenase [Desulfatitalea sp.]NNJ99252.1 zinc-binding dehydrogenase [Desulfatitalea sp.]